MTSNSIAYAKQQEEARHNLVVEQLNEREFNETQRHNEVTEQLGIKTQQENERHNRMSETKDFVAVSETSRHNKAAEDENVRHNTVVEMIDASRQNETQRHNEAMESLEGSSIDVGWYNAYTARSNLGIQEISARASATNAQANLMRSRTEAAHEAGTSILGAAEFEYKSQQVRKESAEADRAVNEAYISGIQAGFAKQKTAIGITSDAFNAMSNFMRSLVGAK